MLAYNLHNPPANGKQGVNSAEMSQTLLIKRSKETSTKYTPLTLFSQRKLALTKRNTFLRYIIGAQQN
jgi:hypothetical protein